MSLKVVNAKVLGASTPDVFKPEAYLACGLQRVFRVAGMAMYQSLRVPSSRAFLEQLSHRMEQAWDSGQRTGRWSPFRKAVDQLVWSWLGLLERDSTSGSTIRHPASAGGEGAAGE